jgi:ubiquinone biosynthesis protein UbiJ
MSDNPLQTLARQIGQNLLGLAEAGGNRLLAMDEQALERCAELQGRILALELTDIGQTLYFHPGSWGLRLGLQPPAREPDAVIRGRIVSLGSLAMAPDKLGGSMQERIEITGNAQVAQRFQQILSGLDIDWEEQLSAWIGDIPAFRLGQLLRRLRDGARQQIETLRLDGSEYLREEARMTPTRPEFEAFRQAVTDLRHDAERLERLFQRLQDSRR